jgi:hypothetical protein
VDGYGEASEAEALPIHPSVLPGAPEPIEPQLLFLRGAAYLQNAIYLIEEKILNLEGIRKRISAEGAAELRLCYIQNGHYGGVEIGNPDGPLGRTDGPKLQAYREVLADGAFREQIGTLLKKSIRDQERFLAHFDALETPAPPPGSSDGENDDDDDNDGDYNTSNAHSTNTDVVERAAYAFLLAEALRPGAHGTPPPPTPAPDAPVLFTTYHPLLVESHFSVLIATLMLGDFAALLRAFLRASTVIDGLEGYPVFLPPRSMAQAEFVETLERLAGGWRVGVQPHARARARSRGGSSAAHGHANGKLAIEPPPLPPSLPPIETHIPMPSAFLDLDPLAPSGSGSSSALVPPPTPLLLEAEPAETAPGFDLVESLDCARIILSPVVERQRVRAEQSALEKLSRSSSSSSSLTSVGGCASGSENTRKKPLPITIPLHGPRVEIVLAWMAAVWLVELESVA